MCLGNREAFGATAGFTRPVTQSPAATRRTATGAHAALSYRTFRQTQQMLTSRRRTNACTGQPVRHATATRRLRAQRHSAAYRKSKYLPLPSRHCQFSTRVTAQCRAQPPVSAQQHRQERVRNVAIALPSSMPRTRSYCRKTVTNTE